MSKEEKNHLIKQTLISIGNHCVNEMRKERSQHKEVREAE